MPVTSDFYQQGAFFTGVVPFVIEVNKQLHFKDGFMVVGSDIDISKLALELVIDGETFTTSAFNVTDLRSQVSVSKKLHFILPDIHQPIVKKGFYKCYFSTIVEKPSQSQTISSVRFVEAHEIIPEIDSEDELTI